MAIRLTGTFFDINGAEHRVDIYDADFVGSATTVDIKNLAIRHDSDANSDPNATILGSRAEFSIPVYFEDTVLPTFIEDFAEGEENRFFCEITKVLSSLIILRGILTPDFTGEEDTAPYYDFKISAVCGLATLKKVPYHDGAASPAIYEGVERITTHLATALGKMGHVSELWGGTDIFFKTAIDWWEAGMASGAADDALFQGALDHSAFYDFKTSGDVDKDVLSCYDVISHIMRAFNARITQIEGVWWIEQIPYRTASPYYTRHYDVTGAYLSNQSNSGTNLIDQTSTGAKLATMNYDFLPALKRAEVTYAVKQRRNFLQGVGNFYSNFNQEINHNGGTAIMHWRFTLNYYIKDKGVGGDPDSGYFMTPLVTLKIGSNFLTRGYTISNFQAHVENMVWDTSGSFYVPINVGPIDLEGTTGSITVDVITPALPSSGSNNSFGVNSVAEIAKWDGTVIDPGDVFLWYEMDIEITDAYLEIYDQGTPFVTEDEVLYKGRNDNNGSEVYETKVIIGSASLPNSVGRILVDDGGDWVNGGDWGQGIATRDKALGQILAVNLANQRDIPIRRLNGSMLGDFRMHRLIQTSDGKKWMMMNSVWDVPNNTIQGTWFELRYGAGGVVSSPVKIKLLPPGGTPTIDPTATGPGISTANPGFNANPPPTVLKPIAWSSTAALIEVGDVITSIALAEPALGNEFLADDGVTIVNPVTGLFQTFVIDTPPIAGATTLAIKNTVPFPNVAEHHFYENSYLVVRQNAYSFRFERGTAQGQILRWNHTAEEWEVYSGTADNDVLTWDPTNGWQAEAGGSAGFYQTFRDNGAAETQRANANFISSGRVSFTLTDDAGNNETEIVADIVTNSIGNTYIRQSAGYSVIGRSDSTTGDVADIVAGTIGHVLKRGDTVLEFGTVGTDSITDNSITDAKLRDSAGLSVIGRSANSTGDPADIIAGTDGHVLRRSGTTLDFGQVATAGIADDAVTYAKLQNVVNNNRVLGRVSGANGVVQELTVAQLYALLGITGTANRFAIFAGANTLTTAPAFTHNGVDRMTITGTVAGFGAGNALLNISTGALGSTEFLRMAGSITGGLSATMLNSRNVAGNDNVTLQLASGGANGGDAMIQFSVSGQMSHVIGIDNTDDRLKLTPDSATPGGAANRGLILRNNSNVGNMGVNKDFPTFPLDGLGYAKFNLWGGTGNEYGISNIFFGDGAGTGPSLSTIFGTGNSVRVAFQTGSSPTANGNIITISYPFVFPVASIVTFSARNDAAADNIGKMYISSETTTECVLKANGTLPADEDFIINLHFWGY